MKWEIIKNKSIRQKRKLIFWFILLISDLHKLGSKWLFENHWACTCYWLCWNYIYYFVHEKAANNSNILKILANLLLLPLTNFFSSLVHKGPFVKKCNTPAENMNVKYDVIDALELKNDDSNSLTPNNEGSWFLQRMFPFLFLCR